VPGKANLRIQPSTTSHSLTPKKLSPNITIYQHRNFMKSTGKAKAGASRNPSLNQLPGLPRKNESAHQFGRPLPNRGSLQTLERPCAEIQG
jgi:hypothetical protein